jgi:hypothetical protein
MFLFPEELIGWKCDGGDIVVYAKQMKLLISSYFMNTEDNLVRFLH